MLLYSLLVKVSHQMESEDDEKHPSISLRAIGLCQNIRLSMGLYATQRALKDTTNSVIDSDL